MDFSKVKEVTIPEGVVLKIMSGAKLLWEKITFKNQVPLSTDTDGSIYNGTGYKDNVRLSSSGGVSSSAQTGSVTTGFIPWKNTDIIRIKGAQLLGNSSGHWYFYMYNSSKSPLSSGGYVDYVSIDAGVGFQFGVFIVSAGAAFAAKQQHLIFTADLIRSPVQFPACCTARC